MILIETNEDIHKLIYFLDQKIILFRDKYPKSILLKEIQSFYNTIILPWMEEYQLVDKEVDDEMDESIKNDILDLINIIDNVLKK